jgi:uncharacterized protein YbjT (DUF2867 family)
MIMNNTAIVFGATGLVGKELIFELLEDERFSKIKAIVRRTLPISNSKLEQITLNDFLNLESISSQLTGNYFFCCIGTTINKAGSQEVFRQIDLNIPLLIAWTAESLNVPHLVVISSVGANDQSSNFYLRTKGQMEQQVMSVYKGNLKIVRPSMLLGNRSEFRLGERIAGILITALGIFMIGPLGKYKGIKSWDVARGMINATELPKDQIFIPSDELRKLANKNRKTKTKSWL